MQLNVWTVAILEIKTTHSILAAAYITYLWLVHSYFHQFNHASFP